MKLAKLAMVLPLLALAPAVAQAGSKCSYTATVDSTNRWARGALSSTRNTADTTQSIYCNVYSWGYALCVVTDSAGVTGSCGTSDPAYVNLLQSLQGDSYIYFSWDAGGTCTNMVITNESCLAPKSP